MRITRVARYDKQTSEFLGFVQTPEATPIWEHRGDVLWVGPVNSWPTRWALDENRRVAPLERWIVQSEER